MPPLLNSYFYYRVMVKYYDLPHFKEFHEALPVIDVTAPVYLKRREEYLLLGHRRLNRVEEYRL